MRPQKYALTLEADIYFHFCQMSRDILHSKAERLSRKITLPPLNVYSEKVFLFQISILAFMPHLDVLNKQIFMLNLLES